jgi:hypothetical protein
VSYAERVRRTVIRIAVALVALAGSSEPALAAGAAGGGTRAFTSGGISFRYPTAWHVSPAAWRWRSSVSSLVTYLSTDELHDPCSRTPTTVSCSSPVGVLTPRGVLVSWTRNGLPRWSLARQPGRATTLGGHPAKVQIARPGACRYLQATETVTAQIALGPPGSSLQMQACLRGASAAGETRVLAMLATLATR